MRKPTATSCRKVPSVATHACKIIFLFYNSRFQHLLQLGLACIGRGKERFEDRQPQRRPGVFDLSLLKLAFVVGLVKSPPHPELTCSGKAKRRASTQAEDETLLDILEDLLSRSPSKTPRGL